MSIIIPIYNAEKYLKNCLDIICLSQRRDIEVLLIDDGSDDMSSNICDEYAAKDSRFYAFHKVNGGVSSARNMGIKMAVGKFITFVDADDTVTESLLEYTPEEKTDLVCFNWKYTTGEVEKENLDTALLSGKELKSFLSKHLSDYVFRTPWAKIYRSDIIKNNNITFDIRFRLGEDNLFVLKYLAYVSCVECSSSIGYTYLRPRPSKYNMNVEDVDAYFCSYIQSYETVGVICNKLIRLKLLSFKLRLFERSFLTEVKWESCKSIRKAENLVLHTYSIRECLSIFKYRFIAMCINSKQYVR